MGPHDGGFLEVQFFKNGAEKILRHAWEYPRREGFKGGCRNPRGRWAQLRLDPHLRGRTANKGQHVHAGEGISPVHNNTGRVGQSRDLLTVQK